MRGVLMLFLVETVAVGSDFFLLCYALLVGEVGRRWLRLRPCARVGGLGPGGG